MPDVAPILKSFLNSLSALVQKRPHHPARWARIYSPPERGRCLSVSTVLRPRILDCWSDNNITAIRSRNRAADQNNFLRFAHLHDLKILHGHTLIAEMARHALVFPNPSGRGPIA